MGRRPMRESRHSWMPSIARVGSVVLRFAPVIEEPEVWTRRLVHDGHDGVVELRALVAAESEPRLGPLRMRRLGRAVLGELASRYCSGRLPRRVRHPTPPLSPRVRTGDPIEIPPSKYAIRAYRHDHTIGRAACDAFMVAPGEWFVDVDIVESQRSYNRHGAVRWLRAFRRCASVASDALEQGDRIVAIAVLVEMIGLDDAARLTEAPQQEPPVTNIKIDRVEVSAKDPERWIAEMDAMVRSQGARTSLHGLRR
jgi:hypothetical protein